MANKKKSDVPHEDEVPLLDIVLDMYQAGLLDMTQKARRCYLNADHKRYDIITWLHNDELPSQLTTRNIAKQSSRTILKK
jgi:hypothetical protein